MSDVKISGLPTSAALTGAEIAPIVQVGVTSQVSLATLKVFMNSGGTAGAGVFTTVTTSGNVQIDNAVYFKSKDASGGATRMLGINALNIAYLGSIDSANVTQLNVNLAGINRAVFSSTGLAVTGNGTFTAPSGNTLLTLSGSGAYSSVVTLNGASGGSGQVTAGSGVSLFLNAPTGQHVYQSINYTAVTDVSSTGLAVTGALSATGNATVGNGVGLSNTILNGQSAAGLGAQISLQKGGVAKGYIGHESALAGSGTSDSIQILPTAGASLQLGSNNAINATLDTSGNLLLGTTTGLASGTGLAVASSNSVSRVQLRNSSTGSTSTDGGGIFMSGTDLGIENREGANIIFYNAGEVARFDTSGNLGLGVTPSAWVGQGGPVIEIGANGAASLLGGGNQMFLSNNVYYSTTGFFYKRTAGASSYYQVNGQHQWFVAPSGTAGTAITLTTAMTLDASGQLQIGTTTANGQLTVQKLTAAANANAIVSSLIRTTSGTAAAGLAGTFQYTLQDAGGNLINVNAIRSEWVDPAIGVRTAKLVFTSAASNAQTDAMTLDASGILNVGTTGQTQHTLRKDAAGYASATFNYHASAPLGHNIFYGASAPNGTASQFLVCNDTVGIKAEIRSNGGLANFSANNVNLSDVRTKTNIQDAPNYLERMCAIPVRTFLYKDQTDSVPNLGVIAQEVEQHVPELVDNSGFGETPADGIPLKTIYQTDFQYALLKCIQEQQVMIELLLTRIENLEAAQP